jgi:hypothetical protein
MKQRRDTPEQIVRKLAEGEKSEADPGNGTPT